MQRRRVVITGMGAVSSAGIGVDSLWRTAKEGWPQASPVERFDASLFRSRINSEISPFEPRELGLSDAQIERTDRSVQFALVSANEAASQSGLDWGKLDRSRAGVCVGTAIGGVDFMERTFSQVYQPMNGSPGPAKVRPGSANRYLFHGFNPSSISVEIASRYNLQGVCSCMATGCTAGLDAIGFAMEVIRNDMADFMVTGGTDAPLTPITLASFDVIKAVSRRNRSPAKASRPFDRDRDGFLLAEGCGILVLEELEHARARQANILGEILGYASLSNAYHMTGLSADGAALADTIKHAIQDARIAALDIDYINAHGSSTPQNDRNETAAYKRVFGKQAYSLPISSTKSVIGHPLGAASALETIVCVRCLGEQLIPPTANYENPSPDCDLDYVPIQARNRSVNTILCNASGFSGIHSALIVGDQDGRGDRTKFQSKRSKILEE